MRIERIRSARDFALWVVDQIGHALMALLPPGFYVAIGGDDPFWTGTLWLLGVLGLVVREIEQWFSKDRAAMAGWVYKIDPVVDVVAGAALSLPVVAWVMT